MCMPQRKRSIYVKIIDNTYDIEQDIDTSRIIRFLYFRSAYALLYI